MFCSSFCWGSGVGSDRKTMEVYKKSSLIYSKTNKSVCVCVLCYLAQPGACESVWWYRAGALAEGRSPRTWPVGGACWRLHTRTPSSSKTSNGHSLRSACSWCPGRWRGSTCARKKEKENPYKISLFLSELSLNSQWESRICFRCRHSARISQCFVCFSFRDLTTRQTVPSYVGPCFVL